MMIFTLFLRVCLVGFFSSVQASPGWPPLCGFGLQQYRILECRFPPPVCPILGIFVLIFRILLPGTGHVILAVAPGFGSRAAGVILPQSHFFSVLRCIIFEKAGTRVGNMQRNSTSGGNAEWGKREDSCHQGSGFFRRQLGVKPPMSRLSVFRRRKIGGTSWQSATKIDKRWER